jgi:hypothetical protein
MNWKGYGKKQWREILRFYMGFSGGIERNREKYQSG